jgi:predicted DNA-binding transcriptional regulator AlpA
MEGSVMSGIRLARLPERTPIRLTVPILPELHQVLGQYAAFYRATYGADEPISELIPHMLSAFLESDKAFARSPEVPSEDRREPGLELLTVSEFAVLARLSRRQIDRLRKQRPPGFPRELELGSGKSAFHNCPRFNRKDIETWLMSRALW